jgi:hypothetical protein
LRLPQDQCDSLQRKGIKAAAINSFLSKADQVEVMDEMVKGTYKLIYVSPERFKDETFLAAMVLQSSLSILLSELCLLPLAPALHPLTLPYPLSGTSVRIALRGGRGALHLTMGS